MEIVIADLTTGHTVFGAVAIADVFRYQHNYWFKTGSTRAVRMSTGEHSNFVNGTAVVSCDAVVTISPHAN